MQSCGTERKKYSIPTNSTPNHHPQSMATTFASMLHLHKTTIYDYVGENEDEQTGALNDGVESWD